MNTIKTFLNNLGPLQKFILFFGLAFLLLIFIIGLFTASTNTSQTAPEYFDRDAPATLLNEERLFSLLDNQYRIDTIRNDLTYVARNTLAVYETSDQSVVFVVNSVEKNGEQILVTGVFQEATEERFTLLIAPKPNSRFELTITNDTTGIVQQENLSANSQRNEFISTLPYNESFDYSIEFNTKTDSFVIKLYDVSAGEEATAYLTDSLDITSIADENVELVPLDSEVGRVRITD